MKSKLDNLYEASLLNDFYGALLSEKQQRVVLLYRGENYSMQEIAEELGISRQAVHDALTRADAALRGYEEKLGLVRRFLRREALLSEIAQSASLLEASAGDERTREALRRIKDDIASLEDED